MEAITIDTSTAITVATTVGTALGALLVAKYALGFLRRG